MCELGFLAEGVLTEALIGAQLLLVQRGELLPSEGRVVLPIAALVSTAGATAVLAIFQICWVILPSALVPVLRSVVDQRLHRPTPWHCQLVPQVALEIVQRNGRVLQVASVRLSILHGVLWAVMHLCIVDRIHILVGRHVAISQDLA